MKSNKPALNNQINADGKYVCAKLKSKAKLRQVTQVRVAAGYHEPLGGEINMIFTEDEVWNLYEANLKQAKKKLEEIEVFCGREAKFSGLTGWVFEKTILHCIKTELKEKGINSKIDEQASLGGRAKADLAIPKHTAIELKTSGLFSRHDAERYGKYRHAAKENGYHRYVYLTWNETSSKYKQDLNLALGEENVFYLETPGEWNRFISTLIA